MYLNSMQHITPNVRLVKTMYQYQSILNNPRTKPNKSTVSPFSLNPMYTNFLSGEFKTHFKHPTLVRASAPYTPKSSTLPLRVDENLQLLKSFKSYIRVNSNSTTTLTVPHYTFKHFYLGYRRGGTAVLNISKFFTR